MRFSPHLRAATFLGVATLAVGAGRAAQSQPATCEPGPATLVGAADVVVRAKPLTAKLAKKDDMYYLRATYSVVARARNGEGLEEVEVEFSCIDMANPATGGPDLGHCPDTKGIGITGFDVRDDGIVPATEAVPLFLSSAARSPLDEALVYGDVTRRPFTQCVEAPRQFDDAKAQWAYIIEQEAANKPSAPLAEYEAKVAEKNPATREAASSGGCR